MRREYQYEIRPVRRDNGADIGDFEIFETVTHYCENAECEAQHEDPEAKWDFRNNAWLCTANGLARAERIVAAMPKVVRVG